MDPTIAFAEIVRGDGPVDLERAAMLVAALTRPTLDVDAELRRLDEIAATVTEPTLDGLRRTLFEDLGFRGNTDEYYDPANSHLDRVVATRRGIPITLAVVTIAVGRRCGVPLDGVGMPGHFLVRDKVLDSVFVDVFAGGRTLDAAGCEDLYRRVTGGTRPFEQAFLEPVTTREILGRMLANLAVIHLRNGDVDGLRAVTTARLHIPGTGTEMLDAAATRLSAAGRWDDAATIIETALELRGGEIADHVVAGYQRRATGLLARLN